MNNSPTPWSVTLAIAATAAMITVTLYLVYLIATAGGGVT